MLKFINQHPANQVFKIEIHLTKIHLPGSRKKLSPKDLILMKNLNPNKKFKIHLT